MWKRQTTDVSKPMDAGDELTYVSLILSDTASANPRRCKESLIAVGGLRAVARSIRREFIVIDVRCFYGKHSTS